MEEGVHGSFSISKNAGCFCLRGTFSNSTNSSFSFWLKIPIICPASYSKWGVTRSWGFQTEITDSAPWGTCWFQVLKCSADVWGWTEQKCSDSKSHMYGELPCSAARHSGARQKASVLSLILSVLQYQSGRLLWISSSSSRRLPDHSH